MKKIISFSVYGHLDIYNQGAIENIPLVQEFYPGWTARFYVASDAPALDELKNSGYDYVEVVEMLPQSGAKGMFWRFLAFADPDTERIIIRDTDQRLSHKEAVCVEEWIREDTACHRMLENEGQAGLKLMGCAFGLKGGLFPNIEQNIEDWAKSKEGKIVGCDIKNRRQFGTKFLYGADQMFLEDVVWPVVQDSVITHGYGHRDFPEHIRPPWGEMTFKRIKPFTNNTVVIQDRPLEAYHHEEST